MSLALIGKGASYEFRWRRWALLRDTAAAHLEGGRSGTRFPRFASIGEALLRPTKLPARELRSELDAIRAGLGDLPISALVLGEETAAVVKMGARLEAPRPLTENELAQLTPVGSAVKLEEYFSSMFDSIVDVCDHPDDAGMIEVLDA